MATNWGALAKALTAVTNGCAGLPAPLLGDLRHLASLSSQAANGTLSEEEMEDLYGKVQEVLSKARRKANSPQCHSTIDAAYEALGD